MKFLDMRTILFMLMIISCMCTLLMVVSWLQNRRRYAGTHLWDRKGDRFIFAPKPKKKGPPCPHT